MDRREDLRAADVDRQFVAERLKAALDEGRLSLHEYDDRLREAYAARTYGDLDRLLVDLPPVQPAQRSQVVPASPAQGAANPTAAQEPERPERRGFPKWIFAAWSGWLTVSIIVNVIWLLTGAEGDYWPKWVMGPWGAVLLAGTINGLVWGGQHKDDSKAARRRARQERRQARRGY
ncbi:DUF1707 domain-containing protein [Planosporangium thailandense]|uniref:DUF1707 domain-containing protein n=1 Tax=Planosporangium thailandense TaxID=765197 RepID=A0ABX0XVT5_9ACTN|nr:DUF1707 domain-containing protein [Planosporangium thailandense]